MKLSIESLKRKFKGIDDEYLHDAELLVILFNFWPEVQEKFLKRLKYKPSEIELIMKVSDLFAKRKVKLIYEKIPKNRKGVILIENDVIES